MAHGVNADTTGRGVRWACGALALAIAGGDVSLTAAQNNVAASSVAAQFTKVP